MNLAVESAATTDRYRQDQLTNERGRLRDSREQREADRTARAEEARLGRESRSEEGRLDRENRVETARIHAPDREAALEARTLNDYNTRLGAIDRDEARAIAALGVLITPEQRSAITAEYAAKRRRLDDSYRDRLPHLQQTPAAPASNDPLGIRR